jgi:hypothetical protein
MPKQSRKNNRQPRRPSGGLRSTALDRGRLGQQANTGFPDRLTARLPYIDYRRRTAVTPADDLVYNLNSVFDPENTGACHQPRSFDTLAALYNKYRVISTRGRLEVRQRAAHGLIGVVQASNVATALTSADIPYELPRTTRIPLTSTNQPCARVDINYDMAAVLGQTRAQYMANEDTSALVGANPAELIFMHVYLQCPDNVTTIDVDYVLYLDFVVEFFDRKFESPSSVAQQLVDLQREIAHLQEHLDEQAGDDQPVVVPRSAPAQPSTVVPRRPVGRPG